MFVQQKGSWSCSRMELMFGKDQLQPLYTGRRRNLLAKFHTQGCCWRSRYYYYDYYYCPGDDVLFLSIQQPAAGRPPWLKGRNKIAPAPEHRAKQILAQFTNVFAHPPTHLAFSPSGPTPSGWSNTQQTLQSLLLPFGSSLGVWLWHHHLATPYRLHLGPFTFPPVSAPKRVSYRKKVTITNLTFTTHGRPSYGVPKLYTRLYVSGLEKNGNKIGGPSPS